jgi:hypothetical protein
MDAGFALLFAFGHLRTGTTRAVVPQSHMTKSHSITTALLALAIAVLPAALLSQTTPIATNATINLRHIKTGEFNDHGYLAYGTTFWATNHTSKALEIMVAAFEVRTGSNWMTLPLQSQPMKFRAAGQPLTGHVLQPHVAAYATLNLTGQPTGVTWRLKVDVYERLSGLPGTAAHLQHYPSLMERRLRTGDTNISANPLSTKMTFVKNLGQVVSQEISEE